MNLTELRKKSPFLITGIIIVSVLLLIIIILSFKKRAVQPSSSPSPSPSIATNFIIPSKIKPEQLPDDIKEIRKKVIASQIADNHGDILLYKTDTFIIEYIPSPDLFMVTIKKDPAEQAKKQAQEWFLNFGLKQQDLCNLPVSFILWAFELRRTNPTFSSLPDGCTGQPMQRP